MKLSSIISVIVFNVVALVLAYLVYADRVFRIGYWEQMGFTSKTVYYPFFYITSAVNGPVAIPGTLTLDWLQVLLVIAIVVDGNFAIGLIRRRRRMAEPVPNS
jgi:hypothetical protein